MAKPVPGRRKKMRSMSTKLSIEQLLEHIRGTGRFNEGFVVKLHSTALMDLSYKK